MPKSYSAGRIQLTLIVIAAAVPLTLGLVQCSSGNTHPITSTPATPETSEAISVTTYHYDNSRSATQSEESTLTPANVNSSSFGKLFSVTVDGQVNAQPLIAAKVLTSDGQSHDLLIVATENDSVYAFNADAASTAPYWQVSLLQSGETAVPCADVNATDIMPVIGIVGTPVIDPAKGILYLVAKSKTSSGNYVQRLHALSVQDGSEMANSPVTITATVPGTASDAVNGVVSFNALKQNQRPALALNNGTVWIAWASHGDNEPYHGWLLGYNSSNISQQQFVFNTTPNGAKGGIWIAAGGPAFDGAGNLYAMVANGDFSQSDNNYGSSALRLTPGTSPNGSMQIADYFTPFNQASLSPVDLDFGISNLLLPDQTGPYPHLLITSDKNSEIYLINRDNMGKYSSTTNYVVQTFSANASGLKQNFAFFNNTLYVSGDSSPISAYTFNPATDQFQTSPSSSTTGTFTCTGCYIGGSAPTISASGISNAILWAIDNSAYGTPGPAILRAYNAANLAQELYDSAQAAGNRDQPANAVKFTTPVVANGRVYVGGVNAVTVYGLLSQ